MCGAVRFQAAMTAGDNFLYNTVSELDILKAKLKKEVLIDKDAYL